MPLPDRAIIFPSSIAVRCRAEVAQRKHCRESDFHMTERVPVEDPGAPGPLRTVLLALEDGTEREREGGSGRYEGEREYYKRTADADRNTLLKSGQRRGVGGSGEGG